MPDSPFKDCKYCEHYDYCLDCYECIKKKDKERRNGYLIKFIPQIGTLIFLIIGLIIKILNLK